MMRKEEQEEDLSLLSLSLSFSVELAMAIICNTGELKHGTSTRKGRDVALAYCCLWGNAFLMRRKGIVLYLIDSFSCFTLEAYLSPCMNSLHMLSTDHQRIRDK